MIKFVTFGFGILMEIWGAQKRTKALFGKMWSKIDGTLFGFVGACLDFSPLISHP